MITVLLSGGLGNQMFQYAAGKALALRLGISMQVDLTSFAMSAGYTQRQYGLDIFDFEVRQTTSLSTRILIKSHPFAGKYHELYRKLGIFTDGYAIEFCPDFDKIKNKRTTLYGHFQNVRYFRDYERDIRNDFRFRRELEGANVTISDRIKASNSVAIHIRRGDYLTNQGAARNFVVCEKSYYQRAIDYITNRCSDAAFFIFGDDFDWIKDNLDFSEYPHYYVDWNRGEDSYIDMQLMSLCRHNIIANSTFSWWAAFLNDYEDRLVIAPGIWFTDERRNKLLPAFYPDRWLRM